MAQGFERFFKAAIVDKTPSISSAALVSSYHLFPNAKDVVKRWTNEAQEAVVAKSSTSLFGSSAGSGYLSGWGGAPGQQQSSGYQAVPSTSYITQYHALGLLYLIRQQDRMAVTKMIQQLGGGKTGAGTTLKNPMALCMLIRYAAKVLEDDPKLVLPLASVEQDLCRVSSVQKQMLDLLDGWLKHKSDMVNLEAARVICETKNVPTFQLMRAIGGEWSPKFLTGLRVRTFIPVLQLFLSSPKATLRFAATRTLAALAATHPSNVASVNVDLESLIGDSNRSVATYAITTLLKVRSLSGES